MKRSGTAELLEHLFRHQSGRILAHLTRLLGPACMELAEEAVQQAMLRALETWPLQGVPENAPAWLFRVARNAAIDAVRRDRTGGEKSAEYLTTLSESAGMVPGDPDVEEQLRDDELRLVFMCCHPRIQRDARVVLSLKIAGGFNVREIARAFLSADEAVAQRLVRARRQIREQQLTLEMPRGAELRERLDSVIEVIYFLFNEGYAAHEGEDLIRTDLCFEALRLGHLIATSSIAEPPIDALMALQAARLPARTDEAGDLILLEDQDRTRWDRQLIAVGFHHFERSMAGEEVSEYHVQAAIAATHARALNRETVDWPLILELYVGFAEHIITLQLEMRVQARVGVDQLLAMNPSPVVALNRAVAVARVRGAAEALASIAGDAKVTAYYLYLAVRGHLLLDLGRREEAAACFTEALECRCSQPERRFLRRKIEECATPVQGAGVANGLPFSTT